jgi:hypothetical protein
MAKKEVSDDDVLGDCCWAIFYHSGDRHMIEAIVETGVIPSIIKHLESTNLKLLDSSIRILANISSANSDNDDVLFSNSIIGLLESNLHHHKKIVRR